MATDNTQRVYSNAARNLAQRAYSAEHKKARSEGLSGEEAHERGVAAQQAKEQEFAFNPPTPGSGRSKATIRKEANAKSYQNSLGERKERGKFYNSDYDQRKDHGSDYLT